MTNLSKNYPDSPFDAIRHQDEQGKYWLATELLGILEYKTWKRQKETVERAVVSCKNNNGNPDSHFVEVVQMTQIGDSKAFRRVIKDYRLSRYGAYLTAMNGDPRKPAIAAAQNYFVAKVREAETVIPQQNQELEMLRIALELEKAKGANIDRVNNLATMHGVTNALVLMGNSDRIHEVEKVVLEVIDEKHNVRFKGQTMKQIADHLKIRHGIRFKSGAAIARYLRQQGRDDLIAQAKRSVTSDYVPEEFLDEVYRVLASGDRQLLIGE